MKLTAESWTPLTPDVCPPADGSPVLFLWPHDVAVLKYEQGHWRHTDGDLCDDVGHATHWLPFVGSTDGAWLDMCVRRPEASQTIVVTDALSEVVILHHDGGASYEDGWQDQNGIGFPLEYWSHWTPFVGPATEAAEKGDRHHEARTVGATADA